MKTTETSEKVTEIMAVGDLNIVTVRENWAKVLMEKGLIVSLHIGRWRAQAKISPKDLGMDESDPNLVSFFERYFNLGHKLLIPSDVKKEFDRIESRGRTILARHSFDTVFGSFVPYSSFESWKKTNDETRNEYFAYRDEFISKFETVIKEAHEEYRIAAEHLWDRISAIQTSQPRQEFVDSFILRLHDRIPTLETVKDSFYYDCSYNTISMPSFLEEDVRKAKIKTMCVDANEKTIKKISNMVDSVANEYMTKKSDIIDQFLGNTVKHLRVQIASLCDEIIVCIKKDKRLSSKKSKSIQKTIKRLEMLNFFDDKEMAQNLSNVNKKIETLEEEQEEDNIDEIVDSFKTIAINSRRDVMGIVETVRFANLEV